MNTFVRTVLALAIVLAVNGCRGDKQKTPVMCGGMLPYACPPAMYCKLKEGCGGIDAEGFCVLRPERCSGEERSVCACNGQTYFDECTAAAAGETVRHEGPCKIELNGG